MQPVILQLTPEKFSECLQRAAQLGAHIAMRNAGLPVKEWYTRTELARRYGRRNIDNLIAAGKLTPHRLPNTDDDTTKHIVYSETEYLSQIV